MSCEQFERHASSFGLSVQEPKRVIPWDQGGTLFVPAEGPLGTVEEAQALQASKEVILENPHKSGTVVDFSGESIVFADQNYPQPSPSIFARIATWISSRTQRT